MQQNTRARLAGVAVMGGIINLVCDILLTPGAGPGSALADPVSIATTLSGTPMDRLALATIAGALAISLWGLATPALVGFVRPAGARITAVVGVLNVLAVGGCVAFHVATGCLGLLGRAVSEPDPALLAPFWQLLNGTMGLTFLALAIALAVAAKKSPEVPRWLPFASPLVSMTSLPMLATALPSPIGLTVALAASTSGATLWLMVLWLGARSR